MSRRLETCPRDSREQLVQETARLMAEQGIEDPFAARHKAANRLGLASTRDLPGGEEILTALHNYLALFQDRQHQQHLEELRRTALRAMRRLRPLADVRLVGAVLDGTVVASTPVILHLLGITAEEVTIYLLEHRINYRESARSVEYGPKDSREVAAFVMDLDGATLETLIFSPDAPRQAPICPLTGRAMVRAGIGAVERLLEK